MSNIFKNGGGAGIGSYVIVFKDGQLAPDTDPLKLWGAYESGEQVYISVIDEETQDALVPASGWIDADSKLHLVARDFDDDKTYSVVLEYAPIASEMHIEGDVEEGIEGGGVSKEEVEEMIADKADLVNGKVPAEQLPSYVDDILEFPTLDDFPNPGEEGKIYVALDTNYTYRWSGSVYTQVGGSEVDLSDYYRKEEVNELLEGKADASELLDAEDDIAALEGTVEEVQQAVATKASAADLNALEGAVSSLESDLAADEAEIALKANAADSFEVIPYQNQTPLTQEQINKALTGKLAILHNGRVYVPHYHSEAMVNFHCFEIGHNISDSQNVADTMRSMEYVIILLIDTGMLSDSGPMPVSSIGDYANNYLAMANAPAADGKRLIREGNLVANYYDKTAIDNSLANKADADDVYTQDEVDAAIDDVAPFIVDLPSMEDPDFPAPELPEGYTFKMGGTVPSKIAEQITNHPLNCRVRLSGQQVVPLNIMSKQLGAVGINATDPVLYVVQFATVEDTLQFIVIWVDSTVFFNVPTQEIIQSMIDASVAPLTSGLVDAQNDITALQDNVTELQGNVTELQGNVTELQEALPLNVDASGTVSELTGEILGHGVFQELQPPEEGPFTPGADCEYYDSNQEQVWYMQMLEEVYHKFLSTLVETVPSSITLYNDNSDWAKLQLASFKSDLRVAEETDYVTNTYVYNGTFTPEIGSIQYNITLRLVSNNGQSLSSDIISTPILKPSQVENLVQSAIGDVLNTDF